MDLTVSVYRDLLKHNVGGVVIIVPMEWKELSQEIKEQIQELERIMLDESTSVPVYFIRESKEVVEMYETVQRSAESQGMKLSATESKLKNELIGVGYLL